MRHLMAQAGRLACIISDTLTLLCTGAGYLRGSQPPENPYLAAQRLAKQQAGLSQQQRRLQQLQQWARASAGARLHPVFSRHSHTLAMLISTYERTEGKDGSFCLQLIRCRFAHATT